MKTYRIPQTNLDVSRIAYGCMLLSGKGRTPIADADRSNAARAVITALGNGITLFDHADIYAFGLSEEVFGAILHNNPGMREKMVIQSKCGIRRSNEPNPGDPGRYDFSYGHIIEAVEGSLRRLQTDRLDILLLHRPDPLIEPEEVGKAFDELHRSGKVRHFGVSNHTAAQIEFLQKYLHQRLVVNQVELNLLHSHLINEGVVANIEGSQYTAAPGTLDYCRLHNILIQAWAPVAGGKLFNLTASAEERIRNAAAMITTMAETKQTSKEAIMLAWLLRHPAGIQPIIGTTNPERIVASCKADRITLTREEWYALFIAARGAPVP